MAKIIGIDNMTMSEINHELQQGGKFVTYPFVISFILATQRNSSDVIFVRHDENTFAKGLKYFFITVVFGWWGIPWGFIYTPMALLKIIMGGDNVTKLVMQNDISDKIVCQNCKRENEKSSKFCIYCGSEINETYSEHTLVSCGIRLIAYVAKADGIVTKSEAKIISQVLDYMSGDNQSLREHIKDIFNIAKNEDIENYKQIAPIFYKIAHSQIDDDEVDNFLKEYMRWVVFLVFADGELNQKQSHVTKEIAKFLNISTHHLNSLYDEFGRTSNNNKAYKQGAKTLSECYDVLKCSQSSTDRGIKDAYRALAKQYHPDIIQGKGLSEDFVLFANQKLKDINIAYETIKKHRGMA